MKFENIERPKNTETIDLEDSNEYISADQYPNVEYITAKLAKTLSGYFGNLKFLVAPNIVSLAPEQVPRLESLNAPHINILVKDFPSLREVYCAQEGYWKFISEEMRVKGWHYKNGELTQPLNELVRFNANSLFGKNKGDFVNSLTNL